ncbi:MAG: DUF1761 domain-containing protein [Hyphomicrobiaceae bacterium]
MDFAGVNYWAVVLAAAVSFLFGGVYYSVLGLKWLAALGKTKEQLEQQGGYATTMALTFVAQLLMAFVLAGLIGHLGTGQVTISNGLISALFVWVGFVATIMAVDNAFQNRKFALTLIDGLHWLGVLLIQGLIIGVMGI